MSQVAPVVTYSKLWLMIEKTSDLRTLKKTGYLKLNMSNLEQEKLVDSDRLYNLSNKSCQESMVLNVISAE